MSVASGIRAGKAFVEIFAKDEGLRPKLTAAQGLLNKFGAGVQRLGMGVSAVGAGIATALAGVPIQISSVSDAFNQLIGGAAANFAEFGSGLAGVAARTGATVEALSELSGGSAQGLATLEGGISSVQALVTKGGKQAAQALGLVGSSVEELKGLSPEKQLEVLADRFAAITDPAQAAAAAMKIFGSTELLPMMKGGAAGLRNKRAETNRLGGTLSAEDAAAAKAYASAIDKVKLALHGGLMKVGAAIAPILTRVAEKIAVVAAAVGNWLDQNRPLIQQIFTWAAALVPIGAAITAVGAAISGIGAAIAGAVAFVGALGTAWGFLSVVVPAALSAISAALPVILAVGAALVVAGGAIYAFFKWTSAGAQVIAGFSKWLGHLANTARQVFKGMSDALVAGDLSLAGKILWLGLKFEFQRGLTFVQQLWASAFAAMKIKAIELLQPVIDALNKAADTWLGKKLGMEKIELPKAGEVAGQATKDILKAQQDLEAVKKEADVAIAEAARKRQAAAAGSASGSKAAATTGAAAAASVTKASAVGTFNAAQGITRLGGGAFDAIKKNTARTAAACESLAKYPIIAGKGAPKFSK